MTAEVSSGFRADINDLRALAVAAVVLYHFKVPALEGGFASVHIFFVISGYLMTQIILTAKLRQTFSFPPTFDVNPSVERENQLVARVADSVDGVSFVNPGRAISTAMTCSQLIAGTLAYFDKSHLSISVSQLHASEPSIGSQKIFASMDEMP